MKNFEEINRTFTVKTNLISQGLRLDQKVSKGLRAAYETVTGRLRDDKPSNMSGARVAREWLKYAALFAMLFTFGIGNMWGAIANGTYVLCTSTSDLEAGAHYIIANGTSGTVNCISNVSNTNNRKVVSASVSSNQITVAANSTIMTFTLGGSSGAWTFYTDNYGGTAGYLASAASSSDKNYCRVISDKTTATISFSSNEAVINLQPHASRTKLRYNSNNTLFSCYSSGQDPIYLYKKADDTKCATPTFSVAGGTYTTSKSVTLSCVTAGATIRYTTDGSTPTESSSAYSSAITVDASKTIKAKAFKDGLDASDVASATYTIKCAPPTFSVAGGTKNNDVDVILSTTFGTSIYYTTDGTTPTTSSTLYSSAITVNATQTIKAIAVKSGCSDSDVASAAYTMVCATPKLSEKNDTYNNDLSVTISSTTTDGVIRYTLDGNDPTESSAVYSSAIAISSTKTLKAKVFKTGYTASSVASATYTMTCATPTYSENSFTSTGPTSITLNTKTEGATIYYTTDGSTPTSSSIEYTGAIQINVTTTIKVIAIKDGYNNSSVPTQKTYTIKCEAPTSSPNTGTTHTGSADITLSTTYGDAIYYTTSTTSADAPDPAESGTLYTGPIHITTTTKIKAIAQKDGCTNSNQLSGTYTIQYNVTWMVDGEEWTPSSSGGTDGQALVDSGTRISTLPTAPTTGDFCGDRFMGWTDAPNGEYVHDTSELYTTASKFPNATGDQVFYAVFADYAE